MSKSKLSKKNAYLSKQMVDWDTSDVADWLASVDLAEYAQSFISNAITGKELTSVTEQELTALGVAKLGHRKKILSVANPSLATSGTSAGDSESRLKGTLTTSSSDAAVIVVKASYKAETKKLKLPLGSRLVDLKAELASKFDISSSKMTVTYEDAEGDKITISSESDWNDCLSENPKLIKLTISGSSSSSSSKTKSSSSSSSRSKPSGSVASVFSVFDGLLQATLVINEKAVLQYLNAAAEKLTGYVSAELLGQNVKLLMPEENAREHDAYVQNYVKTGVAKVIGKGRNVTLMMKDGSYVPVYLQLTENSATGKRMFVGTLSEAKEERKQQSMLQMVREVLDTLINPAIAITDKGIIQVFNKPAQQLWGYSLTDVVGKNVKMLMPDEYANDHDQYIRNYLTTGKAKIIGTGRHVTALLKDGTICKVHLSVSERKDAQQTLFTGVLTVQ